MIQRENLAATLRDILSTGLDEAKQSLKRSSHNESRLLLNAIGLLKQGSFVPVSANCVDNKPVFTLKEAAGAIRLALEERRSSLLRESLADQLIAGSLDPATVIHLLGE